MFTKSIQGKTFRTSLGWHMLPLTLLILLVLLPLSAHKTAFALSEELETRLFKHLPALKDGGKGILVQKSPFGGLYQVTKDAKTYFITEDGNFIFISGQLHDFSDEPIDRTNAENDGFPIASLKKIDTVDQSNLVQAVVEKTPVNKVFLAILGNHPYYISQDGNYVLTGSKLHNLETGKNLTKQAFKKVASDRLYALDDNRFINFGSKDAKYEVVVATDVNCGSCREFHSNIDEINALGIRVKYLLVPVLGADSHSKSVAVWCSADRLSALHQAYNDISIPPPANCRNPIDYNLALFRETGLWGPTPMLVFPDGSIRYGFVEPDKLLEILQEKPPPATG